MACAAATAALNCGADVGGGAAEKPGATGPGAILDASCCAAMAGAAAMAGGTARVGARRGGATVATGASGRTAPVLDATKEDL